MPRLPEITSSAPTLRPSQLGRADVGGRAQNAGAVSGAISEGLGELGEKVTQIAKENEVSRLSVEYAKAQAELTAELLETMRSADPNDPEVAQRFMEETVQPRLDQIDEGFTGSSRRLSERARAGLEADLFGRSMLDQAELTGVAVSENFNTGVNQLTTATFADPQSFDANLGMIDFLAQSAIEAKGDSTEILKLKNTAKDNLSRSAILGLARFDTAAARASLASGKYDEYISGSTRNALVNSIDQFENAEQLEIERARVAAEREANAASEARRLEFMSTLVNAETGAVRLSQDFGKQILTDPTLNAADQSVLFGVYRALVDNGGDSSTNPALLRSLIARSILPDNDPNKLTLQEAASYVTRGLQTSDFNFLQQRMQGSGDPVKEHENELMDQAIRQARTTLAPVKNAFTGESDPIGERNYSRFLGWFKGEFQRRVQAGDDPVSLLTPQSDLYMLDIDTIRGFNNVSPADQFETMYNRQIEAAQGAREGMDRVRNRQSPEEFLRDN